MRSVCLVCLWLLIACQQHDAHAQYEGAFEQAKTQAYTLLKSGKHQEAYTLYMGLLREEPADVDVNMGLFKAASAIEEYNQAILALERLLDIYPKDAGLRSALVRLHLLAGDTAAAQQEMELAKAYDPELSQELIQMVLDRLSKEIRRWQVSGRISAGMTYDSNVNMGPNSAYMQLGFWNLRIEDTATQKASWGAYSSASLEGGWRLGPESPWWLVGDAGFYRKGYFSDLPSSRELGWGRAAMGLRRTGSVTFFDLRFKADMADYVSDKQKVYGNGTELMFIWAVKPGVQLLTRASLERRDYSELTGRQGWYAWIGEYVRLLIGAAGHEITVGGRWLYADTEQSNYGFQGWESSLSTSIKLPWAFELSPSFAYKKERYTGPATALELKDREDENMRIGLGLSWFFTPELSCDALYQFTENKSTSPLYDYDQHLINIGMTWRF